ncbi:ABC transporter permease subunit [Brevibacillus fluminis]|uniref:Glutathione transport system permease protein GsiD n=1 Tax=Brevibacillus fluminis TaxID=511487 RepID=A0A3M8DIQ5_9BACL|nr:ABC transporter permease subunit [Brevibacillus fluminis]RNB87017.1 ABC transporter permease subunit [Brevibacillus fluminis]
MPTTTKSPSPFQAFVRKFRKQKVAVVCFGFTLVIVGVSIAAPWIAPFDPYRPVTDQYAEKGVQVTQLTSASLDVRALYSDGSEQPASGLNPLSFDSDDKLIASARKTEAGVSINASGQGTTTIRVQSGDVASRFQVNVSGEGHAEPALSQLIAELPQLRTGQTAKIELKALLTDGSQVVGASEIAMLAQKNQAVEAMKPVESNGFNTTSTTQAKTGLTFEALAPGIVTIGEDGTVTAVSQGETAVKVALNGVSTLVPIAVNQPLSHPVLTRLEPESLQIELINAYKHQPPSILHWFGTDHQNRDIFSRVLIGTRETLLIGFISVAIGAVIGTILGLMAGYYGRWVDALITRFTDVLLAFPGILLAIAVIALLGPGITNIIFAVAVFTVPIFIRIVRGSTLSLKQMMYVEAARSIGVKDHVILARHIFPGTLSVVMVYLTMRMGTAILIGAALSFLGLGGDITAPEWGAMLSAAKDNSRNIFHPTFFPGLAIVLTVLSFNLLGDGLRDALDPKVKE